MLKNENKNAAINEMMSSLNFETSFKLQQGPKEHLNRNKHLLMRG